MLLFLFRLMNQENIYFRSMNIMVWKAGMVAPPRPAQRKNRMPRPAPQKAALAPPSKIDKSCEAKLTSDSIDCPFSVHLQIMHQRKKQKENISI